MLSQYNSALFQVLSVDEHTIRIAYPAVIGQHFRIIVPSTGGDAISEQAPDVDQFIVSGRPWFVRQLDHKFDESVLGVVWEICIGR